MKIKLQNALRITRVTITGKAIPSLLKDPEIIVIFFYSQKICYY